MHQGILSSSSFLARVIEPARSGPSLLNCDQSPAPNGGPCTTRISQAGISFHNTSNSSGFHKSLITKFRLIWRSVNFNSLNRNGFVLQVSPFQIFRNKSWLIVIYQIRMITRNSNNMFCWYFIQPSSKVCIKPTVLHPNVVIKPRTKVTCNNTNITFWNFWKKSMYVGKGVNNQLTYFIIIA